MATTCTRCEGTGFLNLHQAPEGLSWDIDVVFAWMEAPGNQPHDVQVCDCCGNGETWYGEPGEHYNHDDPPGRDGPYAGNGGLCRCH